jgi:signal peptidase I
VGPGFGWRSFVVPSASNVPTLLVGDWFLADARRSRTMPEPGEMVVFLLPRDGRTDYVKRVVAVAGQRVQLRRGELLIDGRAVPRTALGEEEQAGEGMPMRGQRLRETLPNGRGYDIFRLAITPNPFNDTPEYLVPEGHFFVLGDNRDNSLDSRAMSQVGFVPVANLVGRARTIYWAEDRRRILTPVR